MLGRWVLQDGNYTDFVTGERRQFALEFWWRRDHRLRPEPAATAPRCRHTGRDAWYDVTGTLQRVPDRRRTATYVLDVGVGAYHESPDEHPGQTADDGWVTGEIGLGVDPFPYMDHLAALPGMPPLIHSWTVEEIKLDVAPRDSARSTAEWRTVDRTRSGEDAGDYLLRCTLHDARPVASMAATGPQSPYGPLA